MRPAGSRLWPLIAVTLRVIGLRLATVGLLKALAGSWTSIFLLGRRLLSAMDLIFAASASGDLEHVVMLSLELIAELWSFIGLGPFVITVLRAQLAGFVTATDASSWGGAAVRVPLDVNVCAEMLRHSLSKGTWTRLLPPGQAWMREHELVEDELELPGEEPYLPNELASMLAERLCYQEHWRQGFRAGEHVNIKELRAYLLEEGDIAKSHSRSDCCPASTFRCLWAAW